MSIREPDEVSGFTDGFVRGHIVGWAWYPQMPHQSVVVEIVVDGAVVAEGAACIPRPDLKTAGIGHGRHAFSIPFSVPPDSPATLEVTVRAKGGATLPGGDLRITTNEEARAKEKRRRSLDYLESVFGPFAGGTENGHAAPAAASPARFPVTFILYSATSGGSLASKLGAPEYSYYFVMREFRAVLRQLGVVHVVQDPAQVDAIAAACAARAEPCLFLSFAPPQSTPLGLRVPTIPVIAWEFPTIPDAAWDDDPNQDWRRVLCQAGRAITISTYAARAIRAGMGADFPVASIPAPVWDRLGALRAQIGQAPPVQGAILNLHGFTWDSRTQPVSLTMRTPPLPAYAAPAAAELPSRRGHMLHLARSQADDAARREKQRQDAASAADAARAEAERQAVHAAQRAAQQAAEEAAREAASRAAAPPVRTLRWRAGMTAAFYRDVVRDVLPRPARGVISLSGRAAVRVLRRPAAAAALTLPEQPMLAPAAPPAPEISAPPPAEPAPRDVAPPPPAPVSPPAFTPPADYALPEPDLAVFDPDPFPPAEPAQNGTRVALDGIVFTAVLSPKDGRKNWQDILFAFTREFAAEPAATLVLKMIGTDPAYWWWEFHDLIRTLPEFRCRVLVLHGFLEDREYQALIAATHFVVNASLAEGMCLPLVEFMSGRRPAIAPRHTAMLDYISPRNAVIVDSEPEFCSWPHDPRNHLGTLRHRVVFPSLKAAFRRAFDIARTDRPAYDAMAAEAAVTMADYCADSVVAARLAAFLGLPEDVLSNQGWTRPQAEPAEVFA